MVNKKHIFADVRFQKVFEKLNQDLKSKVGALVHALECEGRLREPFGKKITKELYEMRIKHQGQWRVLYAYVWRDRIVLLSIFHKKTQKKPVNEIKKAK